LPLSSDAANVPAEQEGRRQLKGAFLIELGRLRPDPTQPRKRLDDDSLAELAASIRRHGVIQPILVPRESCHEPKLRCVRHAMSACLDPAAQQTLRSLPLTCRLWREVL
jgi:hypothetical protein